MDQEKEEFEMQNNSNGVFDNFAHGIEEHPKETGLGVFGSSGTFGNYQFYSMEEKTERTKTL